MVSALEYHSPEAGLVENVPAYTRWKLFPAWCSAVQALGYAIAPHLIDAADLGVPQHRVRIVLVLTKSKHPLHLSHVGMGRRQASRLECRQRAGRVAAEPTQLGV